MRAARHDHATFAAQVNRHARLPKYSAIIRIDRRSVSWWHSGMEMLGLPHVTSAHHSHADRIATGRLHVGERLSTGRRGLPSHSGSVTGTTPLTFGYWPAASRVPSRSMRADSGSGEIIIVGVFSNAMMIAEHLVRLSAHTRNELGQGRSAGMYGRFTPARQKADQSRGRNYQCTHLIEKGR